MNYELNKMGFIKRSWAEIDLDAVVHNYNIIRNKVDKKVKILCVIKADGYGHGSEQLAKIYENLGADYFAVSNIEEAIFLRKKNITTPILILGYTPVENANLLSQYNITQALYSLEYAKMLSNECVKNNICVDCHIKIDTGMTRIGFVCQNSEINMRYEALSACQMKNLNVCGAFTHFAVSDEKTEGYDFTKKQFDNFVATTNFLKENGVNLEICHCANSGGIMDYPEFHLDMVRAGIILYGLAPSSKLENQMDFHPVMCLKSVVSLVKILDIDATVSYGRTYCAKKGMKIATIPIGYADGYNRLLSNKGYVVINNQRANIIGRVCMDQFMVDVSNIEDVKIGDEVVLFGNYKDEEFLPVEKLCDIIGTINYEVICDISKRVPRIFYQNGKIVNILNCIDKM